MIINRGNQLYVSIDKLTMNQLHVCRLNAIVQRKPSFLHIGGYRDSDIFGNNVSLNGTIKIIGKVQHTSVIIHLTYHNQIL
jgi:hypothetical protein